MPDPVFSLIEAHRTAWAAYHVALTEHIRLDRLGDPTANLISDAPSDAQIAAFIELIETPPTTLSGLQAWASYLDEIGDVDEDMFAEVGPELVVTLVEALGNLAVTS